MAARAGLGRRSRQGSAARGRRRARTPSSGGRPARTRVARGRRAARRPAHARGSCSRCRTAARAPARTASCGWCAGGRAACRSTSALAAARAGLARGCGEVVLSGIDLGAWRDGDARLPDLVAALAGLDGLRRVRLSSLEPRHVDERAARAARAPARRPPPARAAAVGRRRRAARHAPARTRSRATCAPSRACGGCPGELC